LSLFPFQNASQRCLRGRGGILVFSFQFSVFSCGGVGEVFAVRGFIFAAGVLSGLLDSREAAKLRRETLGGVG
ncbi:MAG: hypothetical protein ACK56U_09245, partial [Planctomyces sp.]